MKHCFLLSRDSRFIETLMSIWKTQSYGEGSWPGDGKNSVKMKSMLQIIFKLLPTILPHGNNLLPLGSKTHPERDCSLSLEKPPCFSELSFLYPPSTVICLLSQLVSCVDCPWKEAPGWGLADCLPSFLGKPDWYSCAGNQCFQGGSPSMWDLSWESSDNIPSWKNHSTVFLQNHQRRPGWTPGLFTSHRNLKSNSQ